MIPDLHDSQDEAMAHARAYLNPYEQQQIAWYHRLCKENQAYWSKLSSYKEQERHLVSQRQKTSLRAARERTLEMIARNNEARDEIEKAYLGVILKDLQACRKQHEPQRWWRFWE